MKKAQNHGFTLVELIFVLVILALIMGVLVATYPGLTHYMKLRTDKASAKNIANAVRTWYVDHNTDEGFKSTLKEFLSDSGIEDTTIAIQDIDYLSNYIDTNGNKPVSLLNANKVTEPVQNFFVGILESGLDVRIIVSVGVNSGIDISAILPDATSESIATYDGYGSGIIYAESKL